MDTKERFLVRLRGTVLVDVELVPGAYMIGRSPECALHLAHAFVSRRHGSLWFEGGGWRYRDLREEGAETHAVTDDDVIALAPDLELVTGGYVAAHETAIRRAPKRRRPWLAASLMAAVMLLGSVGYLGHRHVTAPLAPAALIAAASPAVVSLVERPDAAVRAALIADTDLSQDDFLPTARFCSGFVIAPEVIATAHHCVQDRGGEVARPFVVVSSGGEEHAIGRVLGYNVKRDYVFMEVPGLDVDPVELEPEYVIGDRVFTLGYVQGGELALRDGLASSVTEDENRPGVDFLRFSAPASPGNSGGPLLDRRARAVGLIFARNNAETYNLATGSAYLQEGLDRFVGRDEDTTVPVSARDLPGGTMAYSLATFGYPESGRWYRRPEVLAEFESVDYEQPVPRSLGALARESAAAIDDAIRPHYERAAARLVADGELHTWDSIVDAEHPWVEPVRPRRALSLHDGRVGGASIGSCAIANYASSAESAREAASCAELSRSDEDSSATRVVLRPRRLGMGGRPRIGRGVLSRGAFAWARLGPRRGATAEREIVDGLLGDEGALVDLTAWRALRPNARRLYPVDRVRVAQTRALELTDGGGRRWSGFTMPLYDQATLVVLCKDLPGGILCRGEMLRSTREAIVSRWVANHARYTLAGLVLRPAFYPVEALEGWTATDDFVMPTDVRIERRGDGSEIVFESAGFTVSTDRPPEAVRVRRALVRIGGEARWIGAGADVVVQVDGGRQLCETTLTVAEPSATDSRRAPGAIGVLGALTGSWDRGGSSRGRGQVGPSDFTVTVGDARTSLDVRHDCRMLRPRGTDQLTRDWRHVETPAATVEAGPTTPGSGS